MVPPMHQDNWNNMSFGSRTLTDLGARDLRNDSTRLKIFSGTANPQLSKVEDPSSPDRLCAYDRFLALTSFTASGGTLVLLDS